jgi:hypothetical protein
VIGRNYTRHIEKIDNARSPGKAGIWSYRYKKRSVSLFGLRNPYFIRMECYKYTSRKFCDDDVFLKLKCVYKTKAAINL